jgi:hypothetical protein
MRIQEDPLPDCAFRLCVFAGSALSLETESLEEAERRGRMLRRSAPNQRVIVLAVPGRIVVPPFPPDSLAQEASE